jgi:hypothetical protein
MAFDEALGRQLRLPEVGEPGQRRLASARVRVAAGAEAGSTVSYLERAGIGSVQLARGAAEVPFAHAEVFRHDAARVMGTGAWRALRCIVEILEVRS